MAHKLPAHRYSIQKQPRGIWGRDAFCVHYSVPRQWRDNEYGGQDPFITDSDREVARKVEAAVLELGAAICETEFFGENSFSRFQIYVGPRA